jgi:hypothetical protein
MTDFGAKIQTLKKLGSRIFWIFFNVNYNVIIKNNFNSFVIFLKIGVRSEIVAKSQILAAKIQTLYKLGSRIFKVFLIFFF